MRLLFIILSLIFSNKDCSNNPQELINAIEYSASTRGSSVQIVTTPDQLKYNDDIIELNCKQWSLLIKLVENIELKNINLLETPSQDRFRDAAMTAELKIKTSENTFTSSQFDHGNPPEELKTLITQIFDLAGIDKN